MNELDYSTRDISTARLRLTDELIVIPQQYGDRTLFHLELPSKSRFYRVGEAEYTFLSLLDGTTTIAGAVTETARVLGPDAITENEAFAVCRWLIERGMIDLDEAGSGEEIDLDGQAELRKLAAGLNPLWIRKSLGNPDRFLDTLYKWFGWIHSPQAVAIWFLVCAAALVSWFANSDSLAASPQGLLSQSNWLWLGLSWLCLKVLHEISHGLAAKRYGGKVPEAGLAFVLLIPMAYVDVTSSYRFRSRWHRVHTALAGMYAELFVAALAALAWPFFESAEVRQQLYNVMFTASFTTLLFNANALMRFDGYFVLADTLNMPNLYVDGQQFVSGLWKQLLLGEPRRPVEWPGWKGWVVRIYGGLAACWRVVVSASLVIAASVMFHGAGVALAALAVVTWFAMPLLKFIRNSRKAAGTFGNRWRAVFVGGGLAAASVAAAIVVPWPGDRTVPAIVQFEPLSILRADSAGFIDAVLVRNGQPVEKGQLLVRLRNEELDVRLRELEVELARSEAARRMYLDQKEIASAQIEERNQVELLRQLEELHAQADALEVRAPHAGRALARQLRTRTGTYVDVGEPLLEVADESHKELQISIGQADLEAYRAALQGPVHVYLSGGRRFGAQLARVDPRALLQPSHESFCAPNGGPLSVVVREADGEEGTTYEYIQPRFLGHVAIPQPHAAGLKSGQSGYVSLASHDLSLGQGVYQLVARWVEDKTRQAGLQ